jgi:hypothetical protein
MVITETQRFVFSRALMLVTIALLVLLNVYALEIFLILIIIEFLVLVELTKPSVITIRGERTSPYLSSFASSGSPSSY